MAKLSSQAKVGLLVIIGFFLLAYMTLRVEHLPWMGKPRGYLLSTVFDSAVGLEDKAQVRVSGVEAGRVESITLVEGKAAIKLRIYPDIKLHEDAAASIRSLGLLGEKYVEITPGSQNLPLLQDGGFIKAEPAPTDMDQLANRLGVVISDVQSVTQALRKSLGGEKGAQTMERIVNNIDQLTGGLKSAIEDNRRQLDQTMDSLARLSRNLDQIVSENRGNFSQAVNNAAELSATVNQIVASNRQTINRTLASLEKLASTLEQKSPEITTNLNQVLAKANQVLEENQGNIKEGIASLRKSSERLDSVMNDVDGVTKKIARGEGTLGKLINEDEAYDNLNQGLKGIKDFLQRGQQLQTFLGVRSEYLFEQDDAKTYITLRIQPREDKFYLIEIVDDPGGFTTNESTRKVVRDNQTGALISDRTETEEKNDKDRMKFSIELAKRFYDFTIRGGLIESSGGIGLDYEPWPNKLKFSLDSWDFDEDDPHLKFWTSIYVWNPVFMTVGVDDVLDNDHRSFFVGAGMLFSDDDLKTILVGSNATNLIRPR